MNGTFVDPQLKWLLGRLALDGVVVDDTKDAEDVLPGVKRAQSLGLLTISSTGAWATHTRYALTTAGRRRLGLPETPSIFARIKAFFQSAS